MIFMLASLLNPRYILDLVEKFCRVRANDRLNWAFVCSEEKRLSGMRMAIDDFTWWIKLAFALKKREPFMEIHLDQGKPGGLWSYWRYNVKKTSSTRS